MNIRLAGQSDLDAMTNIYNQAILTRRCTADLEIFTSEERQAWFDGHQNRSYPLFVLEVDQEVIGYGYISAYRPGRRAMIKTVEVSYYLHQGHIGKGYGSKLLGYLLDQALDLGYETAVAILLEVNKPSVRLLEKFGFEQWGRIEDIADLGDITCSHLYYGKKL